MQELLTTKQVQDLLQVDRITIYRMVKDGRLEGYKVGNQWRFPRQEIENLLSGVRRKLDESTPDPSEILPIHCVQVIQDVFADMIEVASITTDAEGQPLTQISNSCEFCDLILASPLGREACISSWRKLAQMPGKAPEFIKCHAGFQYARGRIELDAKLASILVAGQFYVEEPDEGEEDARIARLAEQYQIDQQKLLAAKQSIRRLSERRQSRVGKWLERVAHTFEEIARERALLLERLKNIAAMSTFETS